MSARWTGDAQPGIAAQWPGVCPRCDGPINRGDRVYFRRGEACHIGCGSGADDE